MQQRAGRAAEPRRRLRIAADPVGPDQTGRRARGPATARFSEEPSPRTHRIGEARRGLEHEGPASPLGPDKPVRRERRNGAPHGVPVDAASLGQISLGGQAVGHGSFGDPGADQVRDPPPASDAISDRIHRRRHHSVTVLTVSMAERDLVVYTK